MYSEYRAAVGWLEAHPEVRVIVVTGRGRRFCVGADTRALSHHVERGKYDPGIDESTAARPGWGVCRHFDADFAFHYGLTKPVVAVVNGAAAGVGLVLACYCDFRFVADTAVLTTAHGKLHLPAEFGLSWVLPRLVGVTRAVDLLLTSRRVSGTEAGRIGLATAVLPLDQLMPHALAFAANLAASVSPGSLAASKRQIYLDLHRGVGAAVTDANARLAAMMREPDYAEGVAALVERRPPLWRAGARPPARL